MARLSGLCVGVVAAMWVMAGVASAAGDGPVDAAIVLAVDISTSIDAEELEIQRAGYAAALRHPDLARAIAAGRRGRIALSYFEWSGRVRDRSLVDWQVIDSPTTAYAFAARIERLPTLPSLGTSIARALDYGLALISRSPHQADKRIIDVSGDGPNNLGGPVRAARDRVLAQGVGINGLPILLRPSSTLPDLARYYEDCVIGGEGAFLLAVHGTAELVPAIRRKLILEISGVRHRTSLVQAAAHEPADCLVGERQRRSGARYPDLYE